jgi:hypothetical protein
LVFVLAVQLAVSQQASKAAPLNVPVQFRIPAERMKQALEEFALQSNLRLIYASDDITDAAVAHEVSGSYLPEFALALMLGDSCLQFEFVNAHTVAIRAPPLGCRLLERPPSGSGG